MDIVRTQTNGIRAKKNLVKHCTKKTILCTEKGT